MSFQYLCALATNPYISHIASIALSTSASIASEMRADVVSEGVGPREQVFKINCMGPLLVVQSFLPLCAAPVGTKVPIIAFLSSKVRREALAYAVRGIAMPLRLAGSCRL